MATKFQIFVSSTYEDLAVEQDTVIKAVLEMGHIPVGMEMFSAADDEQWKIIARHINESDYYVVVVAHRIGSLTPEGVSFTRKEYEYALSIGVPCLGFVIDDAAPWPADQMDQRESEKEGLDEFKRLVKAKPVDFWKDANDLHGKVSIALMKAITSNPREGWVRASEVPASKAVTDELTRLSGENALLRARVGQLEASESSAQRTELADTKRILESAERTPSYRYRGNSEWHYDARVSLLRVFRTLAPQMLTEASLEAMAGILAMEIRTDKEQVWQYVAHNQIREFVADFVTLGLTQPSSRKHQVSDKHEYWSLTRLGEDLFKQLRRFELAANIEPDEPDDDEPEETDTPDGENAEAETMS